MIRSSHHPGIIGILQINGKNVYPPDYYQIKIKHNWTPCVIQEATFPIKFIAIGNYKQLLVGQYFNISNINQYKYAWDNFSRYAIINPVDSLEYSFIKDNITQIDFIPSHLINNMRRL